MAAKDQSRSRPSAERNGEQDPARSAGLADEPTALLDAAAEQCSYCGA